MIRVLQIVAGLNYGGVSAAIMNYYRNIDRTKVQFDFTTTAAGGRFEEEIKQLGGNVFLLPNKSKHPFKYVKQLKKIIKQGNYDIVQSNANSASAFLDLYPAKRAKCKIRIAHSHNSNCLIKWQHKIFKPLLPSVVTNRFACSAAAAEWMFGKNKDYKLINNGIDFDKYAFDLEKRAAVREQMQWGDDIIIGNVGSFQERKNQRFLIELMPKLLQVLPNARLVLIGRGDTQQQLKELCTQLNVNDSVDFLGARNDVDMLLQGFDVFCFPSTFEGLALAYIEALASALPVIISDGVPFVQFGNVSRLPLIHEQWIDRIQTSAQNVANRTAFTAQEIADSGYDIKTLAAELLNVYEELTNV
ncbi:MAG: glycosyltransferase family 1 protein [Clostridiales bacterium]|nr:glycosyltransferase family 1 protein [Clostridiales bacterium]